MGVCKHVLAGVCDGGGRQVHSHCLSWDTGDTLTGVVGEPPRRPRPLTGSPQPCWGRGQGAGPVLRTERLSQGTWPCPQEEGQASRSRDGPQRSGDSLFPWRPPCPAPAHRLGWLQLEDLCQWRPGKVPAHSPRVKTAVGRLPLPAPQSWELKDTKGAGSTREVTSPDGPSRRPAQ